MYSVTFLEYHTTIQLKLKRLTSPG